MKKTCQPRLRLVVLFGMLSLLASCFGPKSPQEVASAFWSAVVNHDTGDIIRYSTLSDAKYYDAFSKRWKDYKADFGRQVIDGDQANIVTDVRAPANSGMDDRKCITFLVKQDGQWVVDYERTRQSINGGALGELFGKLSKLGEQLNNQLSASAQEFNREMDKLGERLDDLADSLNDETRQITDKYTEEIRKNLEALQKSIERALKDDRDMSDQDRKVLRVAADNIEQDRASLDKPDINTLGRSARHIGQTREQLDSVNSKSLDKYKQDWDTLTRNIMQAMHDLLDEVQSASGGQST